MNNSLLKSRSTVGVLLAAGSGKRYADIRPNEHKLLALLPTGKTVLQTSATTLGSVVDQLIIVVGPHREIITALPHTKNNHIVKTDSANLGMGASLALAAQYLKLSHPSTADYLLIALADMPWIQVTTYQKILTSLLKYSIVAPTFHNKRGHPVGFRASLLPELAQLQGDQGARSILHKYGCRHVPVSDPAVLLDIDTPSDITDYYSNNKKAFSPNL